VKSAKTLYGILGSVQFLNVISYSAKNAFRTGSRKTINVQIKTAELNLILKT
jgi:hypothetical protein